MYILYIDPGAGSLLFQALLSGFLTIVVFFKRIKAFIMMKFMSKEDKDMHKDEKTNEPS